MDFFLSKFLPLFVMPLMLAITLFAAAFFLATKNKKRLPMLFSGAAAFVLYFHAIPVTGNWFATAWEGKAYVQDRVNVPEMSAIVVLGGFTERLPEFPDEVFFGGGIDRLIAGITLWRHGKAPFLVLSGGTVPGEPYAPEAEAMAQFARSFAQMPDSVLLLEPRSVNTLQNARFTAALFDSLGMQKRIILVTSAFHIRRAKLFFQREGFDVHLYPTDFLSNSKKEFEFPFAIIPTAENLAYTTRLYREIIGYTWHRFKP